MLKRFSSGFTIVELLIVIVVIGILAAITIVSYNGITNSAHDISVKRDLLHIKEKIDVFNLQNGESVKGSSLSELGVRISKSAYATEPVTHVNIMACFDTSKNEYAVISQSKSGALYYISSSQGATAYSGSVIIGDDWETNHDSHACRVLIPGFDLGSASYSNYAGYNSNDLVNGPWRPWVNN